VTVERWGGDSALSAQVRTVEPAGFTKVSALGIEEQRVHVIADFTSLPALWKALGDGYRIEARVVLFDLPDVVRVPLSALFRDGDAWAVFTLTGASVTHTRITIGRRNQRYAEVLSGLAEGTRVIVHPSDKLKEGVHVMPKANEPRREGPEIATSGP
jgi:HlyD family secretion protein